MTDKEKARLFYEFMDFVTNYDYGDCKDYNEFVLKIFHLTLQNLGEKERGE